MLGSQGDNGHNLAGLGELFVCKFQVFCQVWESALIKKLYYRPLKGVTTGQSAWLFVDEECLYLVIMSIHI